MKLHDRDNRNTFQSEKKLNTYLIMCLVTTRHHSGLDMGALQASVVTFVIQSKIMEISMVTFVIQSKIMEISKKYSNLV